MRNAKSWIVGLVVIVLLFAVLTPFLIGIWIQKIYPSVFLSSANPASVQMSLIQYKRGFFYSTAKVALSFNNGNTNRIVFDQKIQHGPIVFEKGPHLALALITAQSDDPNFKAFSRTIWKLDREIISNVRIPNIDVVSAPLHFVLHNLDMQVRYHSVSEKINAIAKIEKIELQSAAPSNFTANLSHISTEQKLSKENNIWYGPRSAQIGEINISTSEGPFLQIHDFSVKGDVSASGDKTNIELMYQAKNSSILNNPTDSMDFSFSIKNIDTKALSNSLEKIEAKKEAINMNINDLSENGMDLIRKGITLQLNHFSLITKQGEAKADGQVNLPSFSYGNIFQLIGAIKLDFHLQVPKDWLISVLTAHYQNDKTLPANTTPATYAEQEVNEWIEQKVLIPGTSNLLTMKLQFENAKLILNGVQQAPAQPQAPVPATSSARNILEALNTVK